MSGIFNSLKYIKKKNSLILTREDLADIQGELLNYTDKAILELLFLGAGAYWLKELTFFDMSQASRNDGVIYFKTGKIILIFCLMFFSLLLTNRFNT